MFKLLLLAIVFWLVYSLLKRYRANMDRTPPSRPQPEDMVQCAHCQVHLPRSESITSGELHYCSHAHLQEHDQ